MGKEAEEGHREVSEEQREGWTEEEEERLVKIYSNTSW